MQKSGYAPSFIDLSAAFAAQNPEFYKKQNAYGVPCISEEAKYLASLEAAKQAGTKPQPV